MPNDQSLTDFWNYFGGQQQQGGQQQGGSNPLAGVNSFQGIMEWLAQGGFSGAGGAGGAAAAPAPRPWYRSGLSDVVNKYYPDALSPFAQPPAAAPPATPPAAAPPAATPPAGTSGTADFDWEELMARLRGQQ